MNAVLSRPESQYDFVVPYNLIEERLDDDVDTEQHKAHRGQRFFMRSIRHYRHATTKWGAALEGFAPMWFAVCISSGGLASLLNGPFPYQGRWLEILASILFVVEVVTYILFSAIMIACWIIYPHVAVRRAMNNPDELLAYAIPPISLMTIGALTATQISNASWSGHAWTLVAYVLWWIGCAWVFATAMVVFPVLFHTGNQADRVMTPVLFMAPVGLATAGTEAGLITTRACCMSARLAGPMLVVGYFAVGVALFMAIVLYTIYFHRLLASGWTIPSKRPGLFILIGPCGQLAAALQVLGLSAAGHNRFADYKPTSLQSPQYGTFWTAETALGIQTSGILLALLLLGFDFLWFGLAFIGVAEILIKKQATYSLAWWSCVFPTRFEGYTVL
ncbi:hypothetical protein M409DRAFT_52239 [Zasmidium cellare ATCC 36951]|uniref:C4-dicarboxylate transporter/malic acid transport protein n=1 Tax=Zasmidium cellare ATCC 36951 TaxID=1080233 RepID=A0A6A6CRL6_ZASCE|nr:uncharacterized protein M409DRAFT_52239 [Zasmidium cellare ATCC 36951]KAF2169731.1 hypothetical protein M409DRAFT_52239 [Zasmidium cellare ATCC 36951]